MKMYYKSNEKDFDEKKFTTLYGPKACQQFNGYGCGNVCLFI